MRIAKRGDRSEPEIVQTACWWSVDVAQLDEKRWRFSRPDGKINFITDDLSSVTKQMIFPWEDNNEKRAISSH